MEQPDMVVQPSTIRSDLDFLAGGGSAGALMRALDWSDSPLGPPHAWPQSLRTVVSLLLQSRFPMFVAWGEDLGFLYNDPYAEILGSKHPRAMGCRFDDIWAEIWPDISPLIDAAMAGVATYREDLPLLMNRKGYDEQTWFTFSYSPVRDESGRVAGMFCACTETTQKVLAERGLRELNENLERRVNEAIAARKVLADIVEATDAFVQVADLDYRWLAINQAASREFERIFGVRARIGDSMLDALASRPEHQAAVKAVWSRALAGEEFVEIAEFGDPERDRRFYEMRYNTLRDAHGNRIGAFQFVYDVTERLRDQERLRRAQEGLRQTQKMEIMGQLTGGVAHDFNNLLAVFAGGLQILERDVTGERRERVLDGMRRAVARGTGLTRHLLAFSRRRAINPEPVDLASQLKTMREMMDRSLRGDIQVEIALADGLWPVMIDPGEFELAMLNMCVNSRDAMPAGGTITIRADNTQDALGGAESADCVKLSITDTGCGMEPSVLARVFEPFFTTKDVGKGSGLGLPQVYGFAQQSGGRLDVQSEPGHGTTVTLLLPRCTQAPLAMQSNEPHARVEPMPAAGHGPVLLVEDDAEVSALAREMLSCLGFSVIHVASPAAALGALANSRSIEMVLSDIMMPGGTSGVDLAREIRKRQPLLPIVLTTGYPEAAESVRSDDGFELLLKPYTLEALSAVLTAARTR